jgi:hypothetical protein
MVMVTSQLSWSGRPSLVSPVPAEVGDEQPGENNINIVTNGVIEITIGMRIFIHWKS